MSRDERKLQALMGAFEKLEKKNQPRQKRRLSGELPNTRQPRIRKDGGGSSMSPTKADARQSKMSNAATGGDYEVDGVLVRNGATTSSKTSPKQRGTRPQKKRIIDDDDEEEWPVSDGTDDVTGSRMQKRQNRHTERNLPPVAKRPRHTAEHTSGSTSVVSTVEATSGSVIVTTVDGTVQERRSITPSNLFEPTHSTTSSPTVEIKREPLSASSTHQQPLSAGNRESAIRSPSRGNSNVRKEHRSKHGHTEGGRTIVEDADPQSSSPMTPSKIAAQAIRYLPLYTIQLPSEKSVPMLDYYVVDLQIRLLLGMPIYTPSSTKAKTKVGADGKRPSECNPLFVAYPHLHRQQINGPLSGKPTTDGSSKDPADSEIVSQFTLHEKKRFIALSLSFVRLDEVVEIIKRDYPQVSKHLITLTLDIDSLASGTDSSVDTPATGDDLASAPPAGVKLRRMASLAQESKPKESCPVWNGPQKMLPLKYAMKLHYRNYTAFVDGKRA
ncbi:hypothetical protein DL89DRAFT_122255 [Linderina pennispora]|uniref:Uncharacterized protein n=1 Tax=Linderina pennispora TaxID=61395 RepID=A0A1Y1WCS7_9FUNG|nr:uncharacterized protein DL89DRAFT_122255 [Linderina pennispora]ORX71242.1 hypothetical protein DL89DRAFT_122255 [Linderina pennispora]